ncbi:adenylate kinase [Faecalibaculum rodentium]|uniref:adenylate kinase n=1 Tax=Faecalibaculum rodentium TaxID=1702221 RepID=UPI00272A777B|nr:adenylate kinase [Faecalibaculum rodentium]
MIFLISGTTHTDKTILAQQLLEKTGWPYLSMDHLKMGLIRSGMTDFTPQDDDKMTEFLWPILREIIKTAIENRQNLILEGCYLPFDWRKAFSEDYLRDIQDTWLVMTPEYIQTHLRDIEAHGCDIEQRMENRIDPATLIGENRKVLTGCKENGCYFILIDRSYPQDLAEQILNQIRKEER